MKTETKEMLYVLLDLMDSLSKIKSNNKVLNNNSVQSVKNEIMNIINLQNSYNNNKFNFNDFSRKTELIGTLPSILIDKKKFPQNDDIVKLMQKSLNMDIPRWKKKSRNEIIGHVISELALRNENDLTMFSKAWNEFISSGNQHESEFNNEDFVNVWLDFFNAYRHSK